MSSRITQVDPRGPRFSAGITAFLLLIGVGLALVTGTPQDLADRVLSPVFGLFVALAALFAWGAFAGVARHPWGVLFRRVIRPRLSPPTELEDTAGPTFAQGVGLVVVATGLVLYLAGVPLALVVAGSAAFIAAFLNAVFDYCLGCQLYLVLVRAGVVRHGGARRVA
ncbi:MAG TPA: DUF4395 domain-containing protein [Glaciihabitans sp.]|jgi:hypothetical protein|nr:DUF4395 domain-containing protein [Glaciihabitans sp.]